MNNYSPELSLLLTTSRLGLDNHAESLLRNFAAEIDWTVLVENAYAHGVSSLLCNSLLKMSDTLVPEEIRHACHEHLKQRVSINQTLADTVNSFYPQNPLPARVS
jgi:hypothetical protein